MMKRDTGDVRADNGPVDGFSATFAADRSDGKPENEETYRTATAPSIRSAWLYPVRNTAVRYLHT